MRVVIAAVTTFSLTLLVSTAAWAGGASCTVCTCQEAVICLGMAQMEELEEQGPCAGPCAANGGFESIDIVDTACENLPACDHAYAPAASPLWLSGGALGLLMLGGAALKRARRRNVLS